MRCTACAGASPPEAARGRIFHAQRCVAVARPHHCREARAVRPLHPNTGSLGWAEAKLARTRELPMMLPLRRAERSSSGSPPAESPCSAGRSVGRARVWCPARRSGRSSGCLPGGPLRTGGLHTQGQAQCSAAVYRGPWAAADAEAQRQHWRQLRQQRSVPPARTAGVGGGQGCLAQRRARVVHGPELLYPAAHALLQLEVAPAPCAGAGGGCPSRHASADGSGAACGTG